MNDDNDDILSIKCRPTCEPNPKASVLGILQNSWFKRPDNVQRIIDRHKNDRDRTARFHASMLFFGCLTGRRIRKAFGDAADSIVWENASPKIAGKSDGCFPPDLDHLSATITHFRPVVILAFGKVAQEGMRCVLPLLPETEGFRVIPGPHPAARHSTVAAELAEMAKRLRDVCPELFTEN